MMIRLLAILAAIGWLTLGIKQFSGAGQAPAGQPTQKSLASAQNGFGFKLFSQLTSAEGPNNVFISPASVAFALAMTWNGAAGETREAMSRALELQGMNLDEVNRAGLVLKDALQQADPAVQFHIANSLWARKGLEFKPDFMDRNRQFFKAEVAALNFADPGAVATINDWVGRNTAGKIPKIVTGLTRTTFSF